MAPEWIAQAMRSAFPPRGGTPLRKLERIAGRIDRRTDDMASALAAVSEKLHA